MLPICWLGCVPEELPPQLDRANIASNEANTPIAFETRIANLLFKPKIVLKKLGPTPDSAAGRVNTGARGKLRENADNRVARRAKSPSRNLAVETALRVLGAS
jgi:hypothetical protein